MNEDKAARLAAIRERNAAKRADEAPAAGTGTRTTIYQPAPAPNDTFTDLPPAMALHTLLLVLLASAAGALAAAVVLPSWLPHLSESLLGPEPKAYWYLARASAFVAYGLLWLSMILGLTMTNKLARVWPGGPVAFDLHQHASLLGLAFALFHALVLLGDRYIGYTLPQLLMPFALLCGLVSLGRMDRRSPGRVLAEPWGLRPLHALALRLGALFLREAGGLLVAHRHLALGLGGLARSGGRSRRLVAGHTKRGQRSKGKSTSNRRTHAAKQARSIAICQECSANQRGTDPFWRSFSILAQRG